MDPNHSHLTPISYFDGFEDNEIGDRYKVISYLGKGSFGEVCSALDLQLHINVAIKKCKFIFFSNVTTRRTLREIRILRFLNHANVIKMINTIKPCPDFQNIYLIFELMDSDLFEVINSKQLLSELMSGLSYLHSAFICHRDLKPRNILVKKDGTLKIGDFGLARIYDASLFSTKGVCKMSDYVTTRFYRSPEVLVGFPDYSISIDIWACGCIIAEMYMRKPLFQGSNNINQLMIIIKYLVEPKIDFSRRCQSQPIAEFFKTLNHVMVDEEIACVNNLLRPNFRPFAFDLIRKMLQWDPVDRIDAVSALLHPYFKHPDLKTKEVDKQMENSIDSTSFQENFKFEKSDSAVTLKQELIKEIAYYDSRDNKINSASSALSSFYYDSTKPISPVKGDPMAPLESISNEPRHDDGPSQGSQPAPAPLDTSNGFSRNLRAEKSTGTTSIGAGGGETSSKICTFKPFNVADFDSMPALHH